MAFNKVQYDNEWRKANKDRFTVEIPKGKKRILKELADQQKRPVSEIVIEALEAYYQINLTD